MKKKYYLDNDKTENKKSKANIADNEIFITF